ncbi:1849_t:CDS:2 [Acaulospora morrowiae]|uniref:1849_t:CDS:1 n=1 Tax=Acaulospora morrowiae TaxID=94023 RepID=A0A9N9AY91_9GLOM|nr:1849_t:CDS:2 [Acaulospora morrowiae]
MYKSIIIIVLLYTLSFFATVSALPIGMKRSGIDSADDTAFGLSVTNKHQDDSIIVKRDLNSKKNIAEVANIRKRADDPSLAAEAEIIMSTTHSKKKPLLVEELPPQVTSYLSRYPVNERACVVRKLLAYAVGSFEQKSDEIPNKQAHQPFSRGCEEITKQNTDNGFATPDEWMDCLVTLPKKMVDEMTQTPGGYVHTPEKMARGTRGYKKLFAELPHKKFVTNENPRPRVDSEHETPRTCSSPEPSSCSTIASDEDEDPQGHTCRRDPFLVHVPKKSKRALPQNSRRIPLTTRVVSQNKSPVEIASEFLDNAFMAYLEPPPKEGCNTEVDDHLKGIILKARKKALRNDFLLAE